MATKIPWTGTGATTTVASVSALTSAIAAASAGDTIQLADGTYNLTAAIVLNKAVRLKAQNPKGASLRGATAAPTAANVETTPAHVAYGIQVRADGAWVEDLELKYFGIGIDLDNTNDVVVQGCRVESCFDAGISVFDCARPRMHMNELRDPYLAGDTGGSLLGPGSVTDAHMDYGIAIYGADAARITNNYFHGVFNQACSFKEGNRDAYAADNTFEGFALTALFIGQNNPHNGPYEHSGLPNGPDIGTIVVERNAFRPVVGAGKTYFANLAIRVWHANANVTVRDNVVECARGGILIEGREGSEAGYATGTVTLSGNTIGGRWKDAAGTLTNVGLAAVRLYKGVQASISLQNNVWVLEDTGITPCFDDGGIGSCPLYTESGTVVRSTVSLNLALKAPVATLDPDLSFAGATGLPSKPLPTLRQLNSTEEPKLRAVLDELQTILVGRVKHVHMAAPGVFAPAPAWQTIALGRATWTPVNGTQGLQVYKDPFGVVHFRGAAAPNVAISGGPTSAAIGVLPAGLRPQANTNAALWDLSGSTPARNIQIRADGGIVVHFTAGLDARGWTFDKIPSYKAAG